MTPIKLFYYFYITHSYSLSDIIAYSQLITCCNTLIPQTPFILLDVPFLLLTPPYFTQIIL